MTLAFVYTIYADDATPLYVGCTTVPQKRLDQHRDQPWWAEPTFAAAEMYSSWDPAWRREKHLIYTMRPRGNTRVLVPIGKQGALLTGFVGTIVAERDETRLVYDTAEVEAWYARHDSSPGRRAS